MTSQARTERLLSDIIRVFPKFFDDFKGWEYENGKDAGKDFKRIFNRAKKLHNDLTKNN